MAAMEAKTDTDLETIASTTSGSFDGALSSDGDMKSLDGLAKVPAAGSSSVFRRGGTFPTAICLSKAAIGAGVLSMAAHSAEVGALYQFICLVFGGMLTVISIRIISTATIRRAVSSSGAATYLIVCGQVYVVVFQASHRARNIFLVLIGIFICCPLALARHVGFMRHLAAVSVGALLLLVVTVAWYLGDNGIDESITTENFLFGPGEASVFTYMNSINNLVLAYNNQFNVPQLTGELTPQPSVRGMTKVSLCSTVIAFCFYGAVSVLGVLAFGVEEGQKDSLILDLMPARKQVLVLISLLTVMFSVLTCLQFHVYPMRQFVAWNVRKLRGRNASDGDKTDVSCCGRSMTRWYDIIGALCSVILMVLIAVVITSIRTILDFIGAFGSAYISYVVPPLWIIALRRKSQGSGFRWFSAEMLFCLAFLGLGIFLFVFGTYAATAPLLRGA